MLRRAPPVFLLLLTILLTFAAVAPASPAAAATCATPSLIDGADPSLASLDAQVRLDYLQRGLERAARRARSWTWAWGVVYGGLVVGQLAVVPLLAKEARPERYIGAGAAGLGFLLVVANPLRVIRDARRLDALVAARVRTGGADDVCALVAEAERLLVRDAAMENRVNKWWSRVATVGFNIGCGLVVALAFHRLPGAVMNSIGGLAIGQISLNTQPTESVALLRRYRDGKLDALPPPSPPLAWSVGPLVGGGQYGLQAALTF